MEKVWMPGPRSTSTETVMASTPMTLPVWTRENMTTPEVGTHLLRPLGLSSSARRCCGGLGYSKAAPQLPGLGAT